MRGEGPLIGDPALPELHDYAGGAPCYPHHRAPVGPPWQFLFTIGDAGEADDDPYFLNFGYGYGYGFLSPDHLEGRFAWTCD